MFNIALLFLTLLDKFSLWDKFFTPLNMVESSNITIKKWHWNLKLSTLYHHVYLWAQCLWRLWSRPQNEAKESAIRYVINWTDSVILTLVTPWPLAFCFKCSIHARFYSADKTLHFLDYDQNFYLKNSYKNILLVWSMCLHRTLQSQRESWEEVMEIQWLDARSPQYECGLIKNIKIYSLLYPRW